jgi:molybdopterin synthase catalytic subunit
VVSQASHYHRLSEKRPSVSASQEILEEVRQKVQIWKTVYYEGEDENDAEWKENT